MRWRVSAWTHPGSGTFEVIDHSIPIIEGSFSDPEEPRGRCQFTVPATYGWQDLITADPVTPANNRNALIRLYRDGVDNTGNPDQEFYLERFQRRVGEDGAETVVLFGRAWRAAGLDAAVIRWWDWEAGKERTFFPDWVYGGPELLDNTDGSSGSSIDETQKITVTHESPKHTHLPSSINSTQTSINVDNASVFGSVGVGDPSYARIDNELMEITAISGNTLTVVRGHAGTTAAAHSAGLNNIHKHPGGVFTVHFDGDNIAGLDFNPSAPVDTDAADLEAALESLTTITSVSVQAEDTEKATPSPGHSGILSSDKVFYQRTYTVEFSDPSGSVPEIQIESFIENATVSVSVEQQGGPGEPDSWEISQDPDGDEHGTYGGPPAIQSSDPAAGQPADSILVRARSRYAGGQQTRRVTPGAPIQGSAEVRPTAAVTGAYALVIRDAHTLELVAHSGDISAAPGSFTALTIGSDVLVPETTEEVIFRVAVVSSDPDTHGDFYIRNPSLREGLPASTLGVIADDMLDDAHTDHPTLVRIPWITKGAWTDANDEEGDPWVREESITLKRGKHYGTDIFGGDFHDLGYLHDLDPKAATPEWDLQLWNPDNQGQTRTTIGFVLAFGVDGGIVAGRIPKQTRVLAEGADGLITEAADATQEGLTGVWERWVGTPDITNLATLEAKAQEQLDVDLENNMAVTVELDPTAPTPYAEFQRGDTAPFQAAGYYDQHNRRITEIRLTAQTGDNGELHWTPAVTASKLLTGDHAIREGLHRLLTAYKRMPEGDDRAGRDAGGDQEPPTGAYIHLLRTSPQTIAVGGDPIEWDALHVEPHEFDPAAPVVAVGIPKAGYYDGLVQAAWQAWRKAGSVQVIRERDGGDTIVWPPYVDDAIWTADYRARAFSEPVKGIRCEKGDTIRIHIDPGSGSAEVLAWASLTLELVDRAGKEAWELVFSADNHGVTWDGTSWWTTLGNKDNVDPALFERQANGTILNSYDGYDTHATQARNRGIVYVGGFLYGIGNEEKVTKIDPADGSVVSTFNCVTTDTTDGRNGITHDGTNLFVTETANHDRIEEYTVAGAHVQNHTVAGRTLAGITWDGTHFWATLIGSSSIVRLDASFSEVATTPGPTSVNHGCQYRDGYLYVMTPSGLYRKAV